MTSDAEQEKRFAPYRRKKEMWYRLSKRIELDLSYQQLLIFSAHLFVYLDGQDEFREGPSIETVKSIGSRVFALCGAEQARVTLMLTLWEARALKLVFRLLVQCYREEPLSPCRDESLRDLAMCQALLQRAKRHPAPSSRKERQA